MAKTDPSPAAMRTQDVPQSLPRHMVWGMAAASGATVANLYYNQPLLPEIARTFGVADHAVGLIPTLTQIGYGVGMLLVVPLGDSQERRRLVLILTGLVTIALLGAAAAPFLAVLAAASLAIGIATCVPQILIPYAATLAPPQERGRVVGTVTGGLLFGVLLSRTFAGFVGEALGWRAVYLLAAGLMVLLGVLLRLELPPSEPAAPMPYPALMRSLRALVREEPVLRVHALLGGLGFAALSAFWATLALFLRDLPGHYGPRTAGLFGVVGVVGAVAAPLVGGASAARHDRRINAIALSAMLVGFAVLAAVGGSLPWIAVAVVLLDFGAQANHVANQARIFSLREEARSRLNTVYMVTYFSGGALGAYAGALAYATRGWLGVCGVAAALCAAALLVIVRGRKRA
jgi:predicted MFS family arabinose efflux permease